MWHSFHHSIHHSVNYTPHVRELHHLFWSSSIVSIGRAMVQLLVPAYLLTLGYSLPDVCLFLIISYSGMIVVNYLTVLLLGRISPNTLMGAGNLWAVFTYVALLLMATTGMPFWVPALADGIYKGLHEVPYHLSFSKSRQRRKGASQIGLMETFSILAAGIAPALGGVTASLFGIGWVYGVAAGIFLIATIVILRGVDVAKHRRFKPKLLSRRVTRDLVANTLISSLDVVDRVVWPLIIFLLIKSYAGVGVLSSVVVLTSAATAFWVGRRADRHGERRYLRHGSWLTSITNGLRLLAASTVHVFGINLFSGISGSLLITPYISRYYKHADQEPRLEYVWAMATSYAVGWVLFMSVLFVLASLLPISTALAIFVILAVPLSFSVRLIR